MDSSIIDRAHVLEALRGAQTVDQAARRVKLTRPQLRTYVFRNQLHSALFRIERGAQTSPKLVDLTGERFADGEILVIVRAGHSSNRAARWLVEFTTCGHFVLRAGIKLREDDKRGHTPMCPVCKPCGRGVKVSRGAWV